MTTQAQQSSQHLAAALELLDELGAVNRGADANSQTQAVTATAHAVLVLAEQVAAIRVLMVGGALSHGQQNGQAASQQEEETPKKRWWG